MNRKELVEAILNHKELNHMTKKDADAFINTMLETVKKAVKKGWFCRGNITTFIRCPNSI